MRKLQARIDRAEKDDKKTKETVQSIADVNKNLTKTVNALRSEIALVRQSCAKMQQELSSPLPDPMEMQQKQCPSMTDEIMMKESLFSPFSNQMTLQGSMGFPLINDIGIAESSVKTKDEQVRIAYR